MGQFKQRGNFTECVQWTGYNLDEVKEFVERVYGRSFAVLEFFETAIKHLVIIDNLDLNTAHVLGRVPISRGTWLVDQGKSPETFMGFVLCSDERFKTLYEAVEE